MSTKVLSSGHELGVWLTDYATEHRKVDNGHECICGWLNGDGGITSWMEHYNHALLYGLAEVLPSGKTDAFGRDVSLSQALRTASCTGWCCRWRMKIKNLCQKMIRRNG